MEIHHKFKADIDLEHNTLEWNVLAEWDKKRDIEIDGDNAGSLLDLKEEQNDQISLPPPAFVLTFLPQRDYEDNDLTTTGSKNDRTDTCLGGQTESEMVTNADFSAGTENSAVYQILSCPNTKDICGTYIITAVKTEPADGNLPSVLPAAEHSPYSSKIADNVSDGNVDKNKEGSVPFGLHANDSLGLYAKESMTSASKSGLTGQKDLNIGVGLPSSPEGATTTIAKHRRKSSKTHHSGTQPLITALPGKRKRSAFNEFCSDRCHNPGELKSEYWQRMGVEWSALPANQKKTYKDRAAASHRLITYREKMVWIKKTASSLKALKKTVEEIGGKLTFRLQYEDKIFDGGLVENPVPTVAITSKQAFEGKKLKRQKLTNKVAGIFNSAYGRALGKEAPVPFPYASHFGRGTPVVKVTGLPTYHNKEGVFKKPHAYGEPYLELLVANADQIQMDLIEIAPANTSSPLSHPIHSGLQ